ncbi:alpha-D-ribose 1-methylphosphonate 5-triphosphate diphosphatase [Pelagibacterium limicola]|uniref:alpha-D-ribose 1-methylphosphonate 5-triphosphate diphosphatase n=1 Tax=Pelagibacterium limicola TaxID=2791022 RepID=UPI0018AF7255|nr:alpha-D-ribose 1-methylphosphonate 5-triphosphate diphosphatase [Pelagibacterium limicola]
MAEIVFTNAKIVLDDAVIEGTLAIRDGLIAGVESGGTALPGAIDAGGDYILPGLVDIHTDHLEKHVLPRPHVRWDVHRAVLAHDAQIIGAGITTVFDSICVGGTEKNPERREIFQPMIDGIEAARNVKAFRAEHLVHLRCEITDPEAPGQAQANVDKDFVRLVSVMEHVPGKRQSRDMGNYIARRMAASGKTHAEVEEEITELLDRLETESVDVRAEIIAMAHSFGLPLLSHDDATAEHVRQAHEEGIRIAEFPVSMEAAREARSLSMHAVAGAPNYLRGGSQSGNVGVRELLSHGLVDILASDYVPRSMLDAVFAIADDDALGISLPEAVSMATSAPARAARLEDRGEILPGLRADIIFVNLSAGTPILRQAWRDGERVA